MKNFESELIRCPDYSKISGGYSCEKEHKGY